jgi:asparagine synthase (glutamine-hydrolysing)
MCGILAGFNTSINKSKLIESLQIMIHRGPDSQNYKYFENKHFLGHNRLSILDLNPRSNQPFSSSGFHLIFNGEVYNYKELIKEHNLIVSTRSDTEVVLEMYKKYGHECLKFFNGMFVIIIYNENNHDIFVARDRLGIKPLYNYQKRDEWLFSSEIAPIQSLIDSGIDEFGIRQYRKLRMTIKEHTVYSNIKQFPPAHYFLNGKLYKYWDLDFTSKPPPDDEKVEDLIKNAVSIRKRSDVPLGSYLSGGLDSTILSYLLKPEDTWTVGFNELNEFAWAEMANSNLKSTLHQTIVGNSQFLSTARWMVKKRKEPLSVPNEVMIYLMTKEVKKKNTVILSGEGADELFWGYDRIFKWANESKNISLKEFDYYYCYGTNQDFEVIDYALENLPGKKVIDKIGYYFQINHLQGLLRRLDNSTMLCSVEARVPFVDHRLVELMAGVSFDWKMGNSFKEPLKRIFSSQIPREIINRKKIGFPVPLESIFKEYYNPKADSSMDKWLLFNLDNFTKYSSI